VAATLLAGGLGNSGAGAFSFLFGSSGGGGTTETNAQQLATVAGTLSLLTVRCYVSGVATTWTVRKNAANATSAVTVTASATGTFQDATHTDAVALGDKLCITTSASTVGSYSWQIAFSATTNHGVMWSSNGGLTAHPATTYYVQLMGEGGGVSTESQAQCLLRSAATLQRLGCNIPVNPTTGASTLNMRKNAANVTQTVTIGAGATGTFSDTTHTDAVVAGDKCDYQFITGASASNINQVACWVGATSTATQNDQFSGGPNLGAGFIYARPWGDGSNNKEKSATETDVQSPVIVAQTLQNLRVNSVTNTESTPTTLTSRKNGANGNLTLSIGATATGSFEDTTHSDIIVASDLYDVAMGGDDGTNTTNYGFWGITASFASAPFMPRRRVRAIV